MTAELTPAEVTRWEHRFRAQRSPALWDLVLERMVPSPIPIRAWEGTGAWYRGRVRGFCSPKNQGCTCVNYRVWGQPNYERFL